MTSLRVANELAAVLLPIGVTGAVLAGICAIVAGVAIMRGAGGLCGGAVGVWIPCAMLSVTASFAQQWLPAIASIVMLGGMLVLGGVARGVATAAGPASRSGTVPAQATVPANPGVPAKVPAPVAAKVSAPVPAKVSAPATAAVPAITRPNPVRAG